MENLKTFLLTLILITGASCSIKKDNQSSSEFETSDQLFSESAEATPTPAEEIAVAPTTNLESKQIEISEMPVVPAYEAPPQADESAMPVITSTTAQQNEPGIYEVRRGDTWMIISQKLLGSPLKWRSIQKMNKEFKKSSDLYVGAKLVYIPQATPLSEPEGSPYLIKNADTLPKISKKVYGTKNQWDVIYFNNREIIKSPDVIYSGFVIYYPEVENIPMVKVQMAEMNFNVKAPRKPASVKKN